MFFLNNVQKNNRVELVILNGNDFSTAKRFETKAFSFKEITESMLIEQHIMSGNNEKEIYLKLLLRNVTNFINTEFSENREVKLDALEKALPSFAPATIFFKDALKNYFSSIRDGLTSEKEKVYQQAIVNISNCFNDVYQEEFLFMNYSAETLRVSFTHLIKSKKYTRTELNAYVRFLQDFGERRDLVYYSDLPVFTQIRKLIKGNKNAFNSSPVTKTRPAKRINTTITK